METTFYKNIEVIDIIRSKDTITHKEFNIILNYISEEKYARYFFSDLQNPFWINPLYKHGYFYEIPGLIEEPPGSFRALDWYAGRYLLRFADQFEDIIVDVIQKANTENWIVQELLIDCMLKISPDKVSMFLPKIESWLNGRFTQMLPYKLQSLSDFFIGNGYYQEAIKLLEFITSPVIELKSGESSKYFPPLRFRAERYWVNEFIEKQYHKLVQTDPRGIFDVYKRHLGKAIEIVKEIYPDDAEERVGYYWRLEISNKFSEHSEDILDILIDGLRDSILELCSQSKPESKDIIDQFYSSEHIIFRRIALYVLRIHGKDFPELVTKIFLEYDLLHSDEFRRDYTGLLRDQFGTISPESRKTVTDFILKGPRDVEQRANRNAQRDNHEVTDKDRQIVQDQWKQYYLEIVKDFLSEEMLIYLNHLDEIYGKTDITETPLVVTSSWGSAPSPLSNEGISSMSFDELQQYFISYMPDDLFLNPRESLGRIFQQLVSEKPSFYLEFAPFLHNPEMRFVYIYNYIFGLREGMKRENVHLDNDLLSLCKYIVQTEYDHFEATAGDHEPGLLAAKREVASLLEQSLKSNDPYLSRSHLDLVRDMLIALCHHSDPKIEDESASTFDPFTKSFNCVRGIAMHGIFQYSLYIARQMGTKENAKPEEGFLEPKIRDLLEEKLDKQNDPSPAVHSVYGCFLTQLHYLSRSWLSTNLSAIFPQEKENFKYWKAAWDAYIISSNVYSAIVELLIPQYQKGLLALREPQDKIEYWGNSPTERLAQHILLAYLKNITDFNHSNQLLDLFFENADDATRARGVFWLSQVLEKERLSAEDPLWSKCWGLWQKRIDYAETQEPSKNSQEISDYLRWLKSCPLGMEILFPVLQKSIKYLHDSYDCMLITEYAAIQSEIFPFESVTLLQMVILLAKEFWWNPKEEEVEHILKNAILSKNDKVKSIAIEIINFLGEKGDYRWRKLLP